MVSPIMAPGAYDAQEEAIRRRMKFAEALQTPTASQGQMVGNHFVPMNPLAGLADILRAKWGADDRQGAEQELQDLGTKRQEAMSNALRKFGEMSNPSQEGLGPTNLVNDALPEEFQIGAQTQLAPRKPDMQGAYASLIESGIPQLQQIGTQGYMSYAQDQQKLSQSEALRQRYAKILAAPDMTPQKALTMGVPEANVKSYYEAPLLGKEDIGNADGTLYGKKTGKVVTTIGNPNKPFNADGSPNLEYQQYELLKAKKGASNVNNTVSIAGPENNYNKEISGGLAKDTLALVDAAKAAPSVVENARMIKASLDKGAITGTAADTRLAVQKAAETLGIVEPGKAATTQALMSGLSKLTLSGIKTSGLGGGNGFTDKDREFLNTAIGGQIADTPENLRRVADLSERAATAIHGKGSKVLERWKNNPALAPVAQDSNIDPLPSAAPPTTKKPPNVSNW